MLMVKHHYIMVGSFHLVNTEIKLQIRGGCIPLAKKGAPCLFNLYFFC